MTKLMSYLTEYGLGSHRKKRKSFSPYKQITNPMIMAYNHGDIEFYTIMGVKQLSQANGRRLEQWKLSVY